jgi:hypothetical protein
MSPTVAGRPTTDRVRLQVGIASGIASEYLAGISRNLHSWADDPFTRHPGAALVVHPRCRITATARRGALVGA